MTSRRRAKQGDERVFAPRARKFFSHRSDTCFAHARAPKCTVAISEARTLLKTDLGERRA
jgi:hypothetical protein